jgi:hypothetical protein
MESVALSLTLLKMGDFAWLRGNGLSSDNSASELFHRKMGYGISERLVHFRRSL